ncbi:MAG: PEP-utilizing enzyme [bacterium]
MKKIEKTISRDLPLLNIYAWHCGYTVGMKNWLGWSYSDSIFYVHNGFVDIMRAPSEHLDDMKEIFLKKMKEDPSWFTITSLNFNKLVNEIYEFYDKNIENIFEYDNKKILEIYKKYTDFVEGVMGAFVFMIWFPIFAENDKEISIKYEKQIKQMINYRMFAEQVFPRGDILIGKILEKIKQEIKLDEKQLRLLSRDEFLDFLVKSILPSIEEINKRKNGFVYCNKGIILTGEKISDIENVFRNIGFDYKIEDFSGITEIKGVSACKGKVTGKVMLVMSKNVISQMKEGFVLVASMTTPEYLPAMQKSIAFITDEGGITCHAAIVARELKKPCIIGTKIATKVLKDGDLVEVDAEKGIVRIIK